jgi:Cof subfamily protein (haloacid dehalogenase superfamily)
VKQDEGSIILPEFHQRPDAVAIDMDGTLLNSHSLLSERNSSAIYKCLAKGMPVIIATSRAERSVNRLLGKDITNDCSLVMQNGAIGIGKPPLSGRIKEIIPHDIVMELVDAILEMEPEIRITAEIEGFVFGTNHPRDPNSLWEVNSATPDMQLSLEEALARGPAKFALGGLNRDITHVADMINRRFKDTLSVFGENKRTFLNVTSKTASKSHTIRRLLESINASLDNVVALGDDLPDYDMLSACGISVAMDNAVPQIKAVCKYYTTSNDDDGVASVLEKLIETL